MNIKNKLIIFAKEPISGQVKTRMNPFLSPEKSVELYKNLLEDTFALAKQLENVDVFIAYTPTHAKEYFQVYEQEGFQLFPQEEGDLGKRMLKVFQRFFKQDGTITRVVILGSDSPTLPIGYIRNAFARLRETDIVLGPTRDGGYYLIGLSKQVPEIFSNIAWSTEKVFEQTLDILKIFNLKYFLLPSWHDLDTPEDLQYLFEQWNIPSADNHPEIAPKTREFIAKQFRNS